MGRKQSRSSSTAQREPGGSTITKAEAVRAAIDAGHDDLNLGIAYVRDHYGLAISKPHFSSIKSHYKKASAPTAGTAPSPNSEAHPDSSRSKAGALDSDVDLIESLETLKPLISQYGPEKVKRLVDLLG